MQMNNTKTVIISTSLRDGTAHLHFVAIGIKIGGHKNLSPKKSARLKMGAIKCPHKNAP